MKFQLNLRYDLRNLDDAALAEQLLGIEDLRAALGTTPRWSDPILVRFPIQHPMVYRFLIFLGIGRGDFITSAILATYAATSKSATDYISKYDHGINVFLLNNELLDLRYEIERRLELRGKRIS
jgi:hypothetical protein